MEPPIGPVSQVAIAMCLGLLFSPWSYGFIYFVAFLIIYELLVYFHCRYSARGWRPGYRLILVAASFLGFVLGRIVVGFEDPFSNLPTRQPLRYSQRRSSH